MFHKKLLYWLPVCSLFFLGACGGHQTPGTSKDEKAAPSDPVPTAPAQSVQAGPDDFNLTRFLADGNYTLQYESDGLLNEDSLPDKVLVLQEVSEESQYLPRLTIILLGGKTGYRLYSKSKTVMPAEFNSDGYQLFDTEAVKIDSGKVTFDLYAVGPNGHIYFDYRWKNNRLALHELTGYFMGAGSHSGFTYLAGNGAEGIVERTVVNTMEEDMPSETTKQPFTLRSPTNFENFDYEKCLQEISE
ncbi:hypothetical protein EGT74_18535 [Chitinophaga lutea]|uniref:Lipoprotein n=1 Tax=Chitinophaga lutea TaxID=2488634 RepID=A0A3N4PQJ9_9BACT|nr:hypothetical protein [Chitinophaga lutea]RPE09009.1 hypothetical protein EGT74_18535 [Chitinophaga lutea]